MFNFFITPLPLRRLRPWLMSLLLGFTLVLGVGSLHSPGAAQTVSAGTIAEVLDGSDVFIQNSQARVGDVANRGQNIRTGLSRAQVNFNTGAVARLSNNSSLTVGQCAQLQRGVLLVNGAVNGCTGSITAGVRGTTYLLEVDDEGRETVKVLEGEVTVTKTDDPAAPTPDNPETVVVNAGEKLSTRQGDRISTVERLTANEFIEILLGQLFDGFLQLLPGFNRIQDSFRQLYPNVPFPLDNAGAPIPSTTTTPSRPRLPF